LFETSLSGQLLPRLHHRSSKAESKFRGSGRSELKVLFLISFDFSKYIFKGI
jgi:hypothetical protein